MHPDSTLYRLSTPADEPSLYAMPHGLVARRFPTIVAERDGEVIGYLGTHDDDAAIVAGPMDIALESDRAKGIVALRLIQAYETVLIHAGVDHYFYAVADPKWAEATLRSPRTTLCAQSADGVFLFKRELPRVLPGPDDTVH